jgi:predicted membrane protein (TIGR00267 family)
MITSSFALGISSGVSVYEAEILERERNIEEMENAILTNLDDTEIVEKARKIALIVASVNLLTPLFVCFIYIIPFVLAYFGMFTIQLAAFASIVIALGTLMIIGTYMARNGKGNAFLKGLKILILGASVFLIGYWIETFI